MVVSTILLFTLKVQKSKLLPIAICKYIHLPLSAMRPGVVVVLVVRK